MRLLEPASMRQLNCGLGAFNRRKQSFKALGKREATQSMIELTDNSGTALSLANQESPQLKTGNGESSNAPSLLIGIHCNRYLTIIDVLGNVRRVRNESIAAGRAGGRYSGREN